MSLEADTDLFVPVDFAINDVDDLGVEVFLVEQDMVEGLLGEG